MTTLRDAMPYHTIPYPSMKELYWAAKPSLYPYNYWTAVKNEQAYFSMWMLVMSK